MLFKSKTFNNHAIGSLIKFFLSIGNLIFSNKPLENIDEIFLHCLTNVVRYKKYDIKSSILLSLCDKKCVPSFLRFAFPFLFF